MRDAQVPSGIDASLARAIVSASSMSLRPAAWTKSIPKRSMRARYPRAQTLFAAVRPPDEAAANAEEAAKAIDSTEGEPGPDPSAIPER